MNFIVGTFVTLGLQLDKHIVVNWSNALHIQWKTWFIIIYNNSTFASHTQMLVLFLNKQPTVIKQSWVKNYLMQSFTSTMLLILLIFVPS